MTDDQEAIKGKVDLVDETELRKWFKDKMGSWNLPTIAKEPAKAFYEKSRLQLYGMLGYTEGMMLIKTDPESRDYYSRLQRRLDVLICQLEGGPP